MRFTRRQVLRRAAIAGTASLAGCAVPDSGTDGTPTGTRTTSWTNDFGHRDEADLSVEPIADGLTSPTNLLVSPHDTTRYVIDQVGTIHRIGPDGFASEPYLDFRNRVVVSSERGLLGGAFHPDYPDDPRLFLRYSVPPTPETPGEYSHTELLTEMEAPPGDGPQRGTERTLIEFPSPTIYHQAGSLLFGPDGYLYVPMGEGTKRRFAQDVESNLLGGIHRIDVDGSTDGKPYGIPDDNPFAGDGTDRLPEYFAWGMRNPWRLSFNEGMLIVGDVGSFRYEEVNVVETGRNYGWPYREGLRCTGWDDTETSGEFCGVDPGSVPGDEFVDPVIAFPHEDDGSGVYGTAIIGGYVYQREDVSALTGRYLFSNYTSTLEEASGDLFAADPTADGQWPARKLTVANSPDGELNRVVNSLGRDAEGRVYVLTVGLPDKQDRFAHGEGGVYRIVPPGEASAPIEPPS